MSVDLSRLYRVRFDPVAQKRKNDLWRVLCTAFFQRYVAPADCVLDLGAGFCEFINHIRCARKIAVDMNEDAARYAAPDVEVVRAMSTDLGAIPAGSVNVVFVSNFFEHLRSTDDLLATLREIARVLAPGGRILIVQPNIRFVGGAYWDFLDHHLPLTDRSLVEALVCTGFQPVEVRPRFLPYTTKGRAPRWTWLVRLYLRMSLAQWLIGKQTWIVAVKPR